MSVSIVSRLRADFHSMRLQLDMIVVDGMIWGWV
jgi:hypothetical protein